MSKQKTSHGKTSKPPISARPKNQAPPALAGRYSRHEGAGPGPMRKHQRSK